MFYEIMRVLQILVCIVIGIPGILLVLGAQTSGGRAAAAWVTLLGIIFRWDIAYFIYQGLCLLMEAVFMFFGYIFLIILGILILALPVIIFIKLIFRF